MSEAHHMKPSRRVAPRRGAPALSVIVVSRGEADGALWRLEAAVAHCARFQAELILAHAGPLCPVMRKTAEEGGAVVVEGAAGTHPGDLRALGASATSADVIVFLDAGAPGEEWLENTWPRVGDAAESPRYRLNGDAEVPLLSVVVPVHQGERTLTRCLTALCDSDLPRGRWELIVVDDASHDGSPLLAAQYADKLVRLQGARPLGPAYARNRGFEMARGSTVVFVDADVCVHRDTLRQFAEYLAERKEVAAVYGSYDDAPAPGLVSRYRGLLQHYFHQRGGGEAEMFWAGCGAVRSNAFAEVGMYDEWRFPRPQIEDMELGARLRSLRYRIELAPQILATHLKRWTLAAMIATDLRDRGVPWVRVANQRASTFRVGAWSLRAIEALHTGLTWAAIACCVLAVARWEPRWLIGAALSVTPIIFDNMAQYSFFTESQGLAFALVAIPLDLVYYAVNGVAVVMGRALRVWIGEPRPDVTIEAFAEVGLTTWPPVPARRAAARLELRAPAAVDAPTAS